MVLFFLYLAIVLWLVGKIPFLRKSGIKPLYIRILFLIKVLAGVLVLFVYSSYYPKDTADIYNYFKDGEILHSALEKSPTDYASMLTGIGDERPHLMEYYDSMSYWIKPFDYNLYNDNKTVIRLNAFIRLFSGGNIQVHGLFFNLLSFIGLIALFRFFSAYLSLRRRLGVLLVLFFVPTLLFWGSGILKESVLLFVLGMLIWAVGEILKSPIRWGFLPLFFLVGALFVHTKIYVVLSIIPGLIWLVWIRFYRNHKFFSFVSIHVLLAVAVFNFQNFGGGYDIMSLIVSKQHDFVNMITQLTQAGSAVELPRLDGSFWSIVKAAPIGFWNALMRPHIFEFHNLMSFAAALENLIIAFLIVLALVFSKRNRFTSNLVYFSLSFTVILLIITGITTPVLGALVRYKLPALPFLLAVLVLVFDYQRFENALRSMHCPNIAIQSRNMVDRCVKILFLH
jgi:hypothetical protein